jgi:membrane protein
MNLYKNASLLMKETVKEWIEDGGANIAAALAYYAIFSLSPLLIIVSLMLGLLMDPSTVESGLVRDLEGTVGQSAAELIRSMLNSQSRTTDLVGTVVWAMIVVWGASGMFAQLQNALNKIWEVKARPGRSPFILVKNRMLSFGIVILASLTLLGTMVINTALNSVVDKERAVVSDVLSFTGQAATGGMPQVTPALSNFELLGIRGGQILLTVVITTILIAVVYHVLPDVEMAWRDVIAGSIFTALLLFIGQFLVGLYLSRANIGSVFGAAGSLTVILVWVYYSAQILLFGAEFTEVWARHFGHYLRPNAHAVWENEAKARYEATAAGRDWDDIEARSGGKKKQRT